MGMLDRVGLRTNMGKTVSMMYMTFYDIIKHLDAAYKRRIMGYFITYWDHQKQQVGWPECVADLDLGSFLADLQTNQGISLVTHWEKTLLRSNLKYIVFRSCAQLGNWRVW